VLLLVLAGLTCSFLTLAYLPSLADSLESLVFVPPAPLPAAPTGTMDPMWEAPTLSSPPVLSADKAVLDDDTPVIGVLASGHARAYLVEAFELGASSHVVNDLLNEVPISVTHCDISGCTRVFTGATPGQPLKLTAGGVRSSRMVLKFDGRLYRQETSEPLDAGGSPLPYSEYPAELTSWGVWRQAHPKSDVYMGTVDEPIPPEAAGKPKSSQPKPPARAHHAN
jgi:hypothetical protein